MARVVQLRARMYSGHLRVLSTRTREGVRCFIYNLFISSSARGLVYVTVSTPQSVSDSQASVENMNSQTSFSPPRRIFSPGTFPASRPMRASG